MPRRPVYSDATRQAVTQDLRAGLAYREIAERNRVPYSYVAWLRRRAGLEPMDLQAAGRRGGRGGRPPAVEPRAPLDREQIRARYRDGGVTLRQLAEETGYSSETVRQVVLDIIVVRKAAARGKPPTKAARPSKRPPDDFTAEERAEIARARLTDRVAIRTLASRYRVSLASMTDYCRRLLQEGVPAQLTLLGRRRNPVARRVRSPVVPVATRRRIIRDHDSGTDRKTLAGRYHVSLTTISNIIATRDAVPADQRRVKGQRDRILTAEQKARVVELWQEGATPGDIAFRTGLPRLTVKPFVQKLKARGGWYSLAYVRSCARCSGLMAAARSHATMHQQCSADEMKARQRARPPTA